MAKKKKGRKSSKKPVFKKNNFKNELASSKNKLRLVFHNFLFFVVLCLVSLVFYNLVKNIILLNMFFILAVAMGFVAVAFLIAFLVLIVKKLIRR